jgi:uncharacterized membrane protein YesL
MKVWSVKAILIKVANIYKSEFRFENLIDPNFYKIIIRLFLDMLTVFDFKPICSDIWD